MVLKPYGAFLLCSFLAFAAKAHQSSSAVPGEYLIKFKAASGGVAIARSKILGKAQFKSSFPGLGVIEISMKTDGDERINYEALKSDPDVEYIEPNFLWEKAEVDQGPIEKLSYDDIRSSRYVSTTEGVYSQTAAKSPKIAESWPLSTPISTLPTKIVVAVIDTGLDKNHSVFVGTQGLWVNEIEANGRAGIDDDQNGFVDDKNGWNFLDNTADFMDDDDHGTHVAGIVIGSAQNIFSFSLKESPVQVMPLKFLGAQGVGTTSNAIRAIYYAVNNGARVINNSWGGPTYSRALHDALTYAYERKVLVVSASGNYRSNNDVSPIYPANYDVPGNIAVASTSRYDDLSLFSNFGATTVHIGSPGEYVASTVPYNLFREMSGTSMAAPLVSGLAARALRESPSLSGYQVKTLLMQSGDFADDLQGRVASGARVNAYNLIISAQQMVGTSSQQPLYHPSYEAERTLASTSSSPVEGGCGLVMDMASRRGSSGGGSGAGLAIFLGILMLPLIFWQILRRRDGKSRRKYDRFIMNSEIRVKVGDRELVGAMNTISEGGLSFNADSAIEKGGIVTMKIQSPDGNEIIEVQGRVVWNEKNQAYGVQFAETRSGALALIRDWTANLVKT